MAFGKLFVAAAALLVGIAAAEDDGVVVLTPDNFDNFVGKSAPAFVEFYAPWCGHCKSLAPDWATLGTTFKSSQSSIVIGKVDADAHRDLGSKFGVSGFPTIKYFPANSQSPEDYSGGRSADDLVEFINGKTGLKKKVKSTPSSVVALTEDTFDAVVGDPTKHKLVEFYAPWCGHCKNLAPVYEKVGAAFEGEANVVVAKVDADKHRALGERFGVQGFPTLKYFPAGSTGRLEDSVQDYNGGRDGEDFVSFLNGKAGTARTLSGGLTASAGRLPEFDDLAKEFVKAADKSALLAEAKEVMAGLSDRESKAKADAYVKIMAKIVEKGAGYVAKESARIEGMLGSESVAKAKKTELMLKKNVLAAFTA